MFCIKVFYKFLGPLPNDSILWYVREYYDNFEIEYRILTNKIKLFNILWLASEKS